MPGLLKIGRTDREDVELRIKELSSASGVPTEFKLERSFKVKNSLEAEKLIHEQLKEFRISPKREFFRTDLETVDSTTRFLKGDCVKILFDFEDTIQIILDQSFKYAADFSEIFTRDFLEENNYSLEQFVENGDFTIKDREVYFNVVQAKIGNVDKVNELLEGTKSKNNNQEKTNESVIIEVNGKPELRAKFKAEEEVYQPLGWDEIEA